MSINILNGFIFKNYLYLRNLFLLVSILLNLQSIIANDLSENKTVQLILEKDEVYEAMQYLEVYEDKSHTASFEEIQKKEFKLNTKGTINFGITNSTYWFRFRIKNNSNLPLENWFCIIEFPQLDLATFYFPLKDKSYLQKSIGDSILFSEREIFTRFLNQRIPDDLDADSEIYIKVRSTSSMTIPLFIATEVTFRKRDHTRQLMLGGYLGVLILVVCYNLFLFLSIREVVYLHYVLFALSITIYITAFLGVGFELVWLNSPYIQSRAILVTANLMLVNLILFSRSFLGIKNYAPKLDKSLKYSLVFFPILICIILFDDSIIWNKITTSTFFLYSFILPALGYYIWRKGNVAARLYLFAWIPFFLAMNVFVLKIFGVIEKYSMEINYSIQFANTLEAILFSFALADRVNILKSQKEKAEEQIRLNLEKSNLELEQKVKERTSELNETLLLIKQDLNFAKRIQKRLLPKDNERVENLRIISRYKPMDEVGGDFFDVTRLDGNIVRILIADATGHGVQAALITMLIKSEYEGLKNVMDSPAKLLQMMNNLFFTKYLHLDTFFSCFIIDIDLQKETLCYASAGHPEQIFICNGRIEVLDKTGMIVGAKKNSEFKEHVKSFHKKDRLLLFTDGLYEEFNSSEEEFGEERLSALISGNQALDLQSLIEKVLFDLDIFLDGNAIQDDITVIGIEWG